MTSKRVTHEKVRVKLSPEEHAAKGIQLANAGFVLAAIEATKKEANAEFNAQIKAQKAANHALAIDTRDGAEDREIACYVNFRYDSLSVQIIRVDTDEIVRTRPMSENERQLTLEYIAGRGDKPEDILASQPEPTTEQLEPSASDDLGIDDSDEDDESDDDAAIDAVFSGEDASVTPIRGRGRKGNGAAAHS